MKPVKGARSSREMVERMRRLLYLVPRALRDGDAGGAPLGALARELGVGVGELVEDLGLLAQVGPPHGDPGEYVMVSVERGRAQVQLPQRLTRPLRLTVAEAFSLLLGTRALRELGLGASHEAIDSAEGKIRQLLGAASPGLETLGDHVVMLASPAQRAAARRMPELQQAIRGRTPVRIAYTRPGAESAEDRGLDPYGILHHAGMWYVVGRCHKRDEPRLFRLDRVSRVTAGEGRFEVPADFDLERYRRDRLFFGRKDAAEARIRLDPAGAARVAGSFPAAALHAEVDGGATLILEGSDRDWLVRFVLGLGRHARVIAPVNLAQAVAAQARRVLARHAPAEPIEKTDSILP